MNLIEKEMLELLQYGRNEYGFTHVRAEFEAEGARFEELLRLLEIGYKAGLELVIKIGGCESMTGLHAARQLGASAVVAPMIESTYALKKYAIACEKVFPKSKSYTTKFYFNIETVQAMKIYEDLITTASIIGVNGVVFGRVDFSASSGFSRDEIETSTITQEILEVARICKLFDRELIIGGAVSKASIPALQEIATIHLSHFETRKIVFDQNQLSRDTLIKGLLAAAKFELLWLKNKQSYYQDICNEDLSRIKLLEQRI